MIQTWILYVLGLLAVRSKIVNVTLHVFQKVGLTLRLLSLSELEEENFKACIYCRRFIRAQIYRADASFGLDSAFRVLQCGT